MGRCGPCPRGVRPPRHRLPRVRHPGARGTRVQHARRPAPRAIYGRHHARRDRHHASGSDPRRPSRRRSRLRHAAVLLHEQGGGGSAPAVPGPARSLRAPGGGPARVAGGVVPRHFRGPLRGGGGGARRRVLLRNAPDPVLPRLRAKRARAGLPVRQLLPRDQEVRGGRRRHHPVYPGQPGVCHLRLVPPQARPRERAGPTAPPDGVRNLERRRV